MNGKGQKIMFACMVYIMGGHLWLYYSKNDKNVDIIFMHRFWLRVNIWWSKVGIMTVF